MVIKMKGEILMTFKKIVMGGGTRLFSKNNFMFEPSKYYDGGGKELI